MSEIKLPPGFTKWDFSSRSGPAGLDPEAVVEIVQRDGDVVHGNVSALDWDDDGMGADIVGWRVLGKPLQIADDPHPHAHLMLEYAKDALTRPDPWVLWQWRTTAGAPWGDLRANPGWEFDWLYRRKPKLIPTQVINGFTVPKGETEPLAHKAPYYIASLEAGDWSRYFEWDDDYADKLWLERGMVFLTEEHAVAVAKAMCGIDPQWAQD